MCMLSPHDVLDLVFAPYNSLCMASSLSLEDSNPNRAVRPRVKQCLNGDAEQPLRRRESKNLGGTKSPRVPQQLVAIDDVLRAHHLLPRSAWEMTACHAISIFLVSARGRNRRLPVTKFQARLAETIIFLCLYQRLYGL